MRKSTFFVALLLSGVATLCTGVCGFVSTVFTLGMKLWSWMISASPPQLPDWSGLLLPEPPGAGLTRRTVRPVQDQRPHIERFRLARNEYAY